eukprot:GEMP01059419.1.p1 GENE.GEMP01059419.1~~GEMP01059419.1.p1  ORF type:complete len:375 (+),score=87.34 GEMP01059419.1:1-1125(+)
MCRPIHVREVAQGQALERAFPHKAQRINTCAMVRDFETKVAHCDVWERLNTTFTEHLDFFVDNLPAEPNKTISQLARALRIKDEHEYLLGLERVEGVPLMPVSVWTRYATWTFSRDYGARHALLEKWLLQRLPDADISALLASPQSATFATNETMAAVNARDGMGEGRSLAGGENPTAVILAAGGGSDVVSAACWLQSKRSRCSDERGVVVQCGRGPLGIHACADFESELDRPEQFWCGMDLVGRMQYLSKQRSLNIAYAFAGQDKNVLAEGSMAEVLEHLLSLRNDLLTHVRSSQVTRVEVVDTGGDILQITTDTRKERDVWTLILGLLVAISLKCEFSLTILSPGIDGQSAWVSEELAATIQREDLHGAHGP